MLIGGYGLLWDRNHYQWNRVAKRRLLGRRDSGRKVTVADFSAGRGVYVMHNPQGGIYYVGLSVEYGRLAGRLSDHTKDRHADYWTHFSWFSFDEPAETPDADGIYSVDDSWDTYDDLAAQDAVEGLEAIMISLLAPVGNWKDGKFGTARKWEQVANVRPPSIETLDDLADRL